MTCGVYGNIVVAKSLCNIDQTDTFADFDLAAFLTIATSIIDDKLETYETVLPLTPVPAKITVIANYYAAGIYMQRAKPDEPVHEYTTYADKELIMYITDKYGVGNAGRKGKVVVHEHTHCIEYPYTHAHYWGT